MSRPPDRLFLVCMVVLMLLVSAACGQSDGDEGANRAKTAVDPAAAPTTGDGVESSDSPGTEADESAATPDDDETDRDADPDADLDPDLSVEPAPATAFNGRPVPPAPGNPDEAVEAFVEVERALRVDGRSADYYADLGHREQLIIRTLARNPDWHDEVLARLPDDLRSVLGHHLDARAELGRLHTAPPLENLPAWEIIEPEPMERLVEHYRSASAATGIDWQILAAINLIETGMGRIDGLSSAGAQGPMQFLPTTWAEVSDGGDIDDPGDAIHGAARYLVQRGGLTDIRQGLFGYNNSDNYVDAVLAYAALLTEDERALRGFYNWEIYIGTDVGTLWLPVGLTTDGNLSARDYLEANPWARTIG